VALVVSTVNNRSSRLGKNVALMIVRTMNYHLIQQHNISFSTIPLNSALLDNNLNDIDEIIHGSGTQTQQKIMMAWMTLR
jgi:hypothetical protein